MIDPSNLEAEYDDDIISSFIERSRPNQEQTNFRMKLAAKIFLAMKGKGWNQTRFAKEMDKQDSIISKWLSGTHNFETDTLFEIGKLLGINLINVDDSTTPILTATTETQNIFVLPREGEILSYQLNEGNITLEYEISGVQNLVSCDINSN